MSWPIKRSPPPLPSGSKGGGHNHLATGKWIRPEVHAHIPPRTAVTPGPAAPAAPPQPPPKTWTPTQRCDLGRSIQSHVQQMNYFQKRVEKIMQSFNPTVTKIKPPPPEKPRWNQRILSDSFHKRRTLALAHQEFYSGPIPSGPPLITLLDPSHHRIQSTFEGPGPGTTSSTILIPPTLTRRPPIRIRHPSVFGPTPPDHYWTTPKVTTLELTPGPQYRTDGQISPQSAPGNVGGSGSSQPGAEGGGSTSRSKSQKLKSRKSILKKGTEPKPTITRITLTLEEEDPTIRSTKPSSKSMGQASSSSSQSGGLRRTKTLGSTSMKLTLSPNVPSPPEFLDGWKPMCVMNGFAVSDPETSAFTPPIINTFGNLGSTSYRRLKPWPTMGVGKILPKGFSVIVPDMTLFYDREIDVQKRVGENKLRIVGRAVIKGQNHAEEKFIDYPPDLTVWDLHFYRDEERRIVIEDRSALTPSTFLKGSYSSASGRKQSGEN